MLACRLMGRMQAGCASDARIYPQIHKSFRIGRMKATRWRIAVQKHFVRNSCKCLFHFAQARQGTSPPDGGLWECARVFASLLIEQPQHLVVSVPSILGHEFPMNFCYSQKQFTDSQSTLPNPNRA